VSGSTVAIIGVGVVAAGAGVYFFVIRPRQKVAAAVAGAPATTGPSPAVAVGTGAPAIRMNPDLLSQSHADRRNAVAPLVLSKFGVPDKYSSGIANVAGQLSLSGRAEKYFEKVPVVGTALAIPSKLVSGIASGITSLF